MPKMKLSARKRRVNKSPPIFQIDLAGDWRACTAMIPKECDVLGVITTGDGARGALARLRTTGAFVKVVNGVISVLNQTRVRMTLEVMAQKNRATIVEMVAAEDWRPPTL